MAKLGSPPQNSSASEGNAESLLVRLREARIDTERFVPLRNGSKEAYTDFTDAANQHELAEVDGNTGIVLGDGLVVVDIDAYDDDGVPEVVENLPDTYTTETAHGGEHWYYAVETDVCGSNFDWGEVRAEGAYVVAPGSELSSCSKDGHDCSQPTAGRYTVGHDRPIVMIRGEELPQSDCSSASGGTQTRTGVSTDPEGDISSVDVKFDVRQRLEEVKDCKYGETFTALWEGRYEAAGYSFDDCSRAEAALASYLAWWMDDNRDVVAALMNCADTVKWAQRTDDSYRESILDTACDHNRTYGESLEWQTRYGRDRPEFSGPTRERVYDALLDLRTARTVEVVEHDRVDRGKRQVQRALKFLQKWDMVDAKRKGRQVVYYPTIYERILEE